MMMKSPICSLLSKASWVITALASINMGLAGFFGIDIFAMPFVINNAQFVALPLIAIIGISGVWSLVHFFMNPTSCQ